MWNVISIMHCISSSFNFELTCNTKSFLFDTFRGPVPLPYSIQLSSQYFHIHPFYLQDHFLLTGLVLLVCLAAMWTHDHIWSYQLIIMNNNYITQLSTALSGNSIKCVVTSCSYLSFTFLKIIMGSWL